MFCRRPSADDRRRLTVGPVLGAELVLGDLPELALVVFDCGRQTLQPSVSLGFLGQRLSDPSAQGVCLPGGNSSISGRDQVGINGYGESLLGRPHTTILT